MKKKLHTIFSILNTKSRRRRFTLTGIVLFLALGLAFIVVFASREAEASWWDDTWTYRQKITFTNSGTAKNEERKVKIDLDTATLITDGKLQSDCQDIRFLDKNSKTLDHFIDTATGDCNTSSTDFYVKFSSITAGTTTLYIYYGNPAAQSIQKNDFFTDSEYITGSMGYWTLDEASANTCDNGTADSCDMIRSNDLTWSGTVTSTTGKLGNALNFNGTNGYATASLDGTALDELTVSFWVNPDATVATQRGVFTWGNALTDSTPFILVARASSSTNLRFYMDDGYRLDTPVSNTTWTHVAITLNTSNLWTFYINGTSAGTYQDDATHARLADAQNIYLGNGYQGYFDGSIDNLRIYNQSIDQAGVTSIYNSGDGTSWTLIKSFLPNTGPTLDSEETGPGPIAYWRFDEGTGQTASDTTGRGNDGTLGANSSVGSDDPIWIAEDQCVTGKCLQFDGSSDFVNLPEDTLANATSWTYSLWLYNTSLTTNDSPIGDSLSTFGFPTIRFNSTGKYEFFAGNGSSFFINGPESSENATTNEWEHLAYVYDGTDLLLYRNGKLTDTLAAGDGESLPASANNFRIGGGASASASFYGGNIDEVKIYPYARTADEIMVEYAGGAAVLGDVNSTDTDPGLVGYWSMDEASGTSIFDNSGDGNTGTLGGDGIGTDLPTWQTSDNCKKGACLDFDGSNDYVSASNLNSLDNMTAITISMWIKLDTIARNERWAGMWSGTDRVFLFGPSDIADNIEIALPGVNRFGVAWSNLTLGQWQHVAVTWGENTAKIYVNGRLINSGALNSTIGNSNAPLEIGRGGANYVDGSFDEVKIYNYARTQTQIQEDMNAYLETDSLSPYIAAYWNFDEGYGDTAHDSSSNSNDGNLVGTCPGDSTCPSWTSNGKVNKALSFDGGDTVNAGTDSSLDFGGTNNITISTWFKPGSSSGSTNNNTKIISKWNSGNQYVLGYPSDNSNEIRFVVKTGGTGAGGTQYSVDSTTLFNSTTTWYHIIAVYDGSALKLYVNGVLENSTAATGNLNTGVSDAVYIGGYSGGVGADINGVIDELKVYNVALTPAQILLDMNGGAATSFGILGDSEETDIDGGAGDPPVGHWNLDEKTGTSANDTSGNSRTGTLTSSPTWTRASNCKVGACLTFSGSNYVDVGTGPTTTNTVSFWAYPTTTTQYFIDLNGSAYIWTNAGTITATGFTTPTIYVNGVQTSAITANEWQYVTVTTATGINASDLDLGRVEGVGNLSGRLDDVKIYDYARNQAQIAYDMNRGAPIAHWKLDDNVSGNGQTIVDAMGNANGTTDDGANNTGMDCTIDGKHNLGCSFDGVDDYITVSESYGPSNIGQRRSLLAWVKADSIASRSPTFSTLIAYAAAITPDTLVNYSGPAWGGIGITADGNNLARAVGFNGSSYVTVSSTNSLTPSEWHHLTMTYDGTNMKLYVDGVLANQASFSGFGHSVTTPEALTIGDFQTTDTFNFSFPGIIDDVRLYNYALSPAQIAKVMNEGGVRFGPNTGSP